MCRRRRRRRSCRRGHFGASSPALRAPSFQRNRSGSSPRGIHAAPLRVRNARPPTAQPRRCRAAARSRRRKAAIAVCSYSWMLSFGSEGRVQPFARPEGARTVASIATGNRSLSAIGNLGRQHPVRSTGGKARIRDAARGLAEVENGRLESPCVSPAVKVRFQHGVSPFEDLGDKFVSLDEFYPAGRFLSGGRDRSRRSAVGNPKWGLEVPLGRKASERATRRGQYQQPGFTTHADDGFGKCASPEGGGQSLWGRRRAARPSQSCGPCSPAWYECRARPQPAMRARRSR